MPLFLVALADHIMHGQSDKRRENGIVVPAMITVMRKTACKVYIVVQAKLLFPVIAGKKFLTQFLNASNYLLILFLKNYEHEFHYSL